MIEKFPLLTLHVFFSARYERNVVQPCLTARCRRICAETRRGMVSKSNEGVTVSEVRPVAKFRLLRNGLMMRLKDNGVCLALI
jgi:hypothetical protein